MRRQRRTKEQWNALFAAHLASGLTASDYCAKHSIHLKTFSARKSDFKKRAKLSTNNKLVKVVKANPLPVSTPPSLTVAYHGVTLKVEQAVEAKWLVDVMKALAS